MSTKEKRLKSLKKARRVLAQRRKLNGSAGPLRAVIRARVETIVREEIDRALRSAI